MADFSKWNLQEIKKDVIESVMQCSKRGLLQSAKWAAEISFALTQQADVEVKVTKQSPQFQQDFDRFYLAKSYLDLKEYDRAAHFVEGCESPEAYFLHMYARFFSGEKKKLNDASDSSGPQDADNEYLKNLRIELHKKHKANKLDGYALYLYGAVLKKLDLQSEARDMYVEALNANPLIWSAWHELAVLVFDKETLASLKLPNHWIKPIFTALVYLELHLNEDSLALYTDISTKGGLGQSTYILAQIAECYHNFREVERAIEKFSSLQEQDPYRLDHMDLYSNLLFIREMRKELAHLAHHCSNIDKYRVETCCVIGNYYSLRGEHEKSVLYFLRALKLNPNYLSAWTLMGHEYMEMKNTSQAIQAYRKAIEVNRRDYRAWYGLGQTYEILKMPQYCLYYFREAQSLRPNDSRMIVALGVTYEQLDRLQEAKKCFMKAHAVGDMEGQAIMKMAQLFERLNEHADAAKAYTLFVHATSDQQPTLEEQSKVRSHAFRFLANYHLRTSHNIDEAYEAATECAKYNDTREEGKALLRQISQMRAMGTGSVGMMERGDGTANLDQLATLATERTLQQQAMETTPQGNNSSLSQAGLQPMNLTFTP